jgi:DNA-binding MarR family transcriptional regulator
LKAEGIPFVELFTNEGKSQDELSALIKIDKATTARSLAKLEDKGYIIRKTDSADNRVRRVYLTGKAKKFAPTFSADNRVRRVYLTGKAKKFAPTFFAIFNAWQDTLVQNFSREEKEQLLLFLERMGQNAIKMLQKAE